MWFILRHRFIERRAVKAQHSRQRGPVISIPFLYYRYSVTVQRKELVAQDELQHFAGLLSGQLLLGQTPQALAQQGFLMLSVATCLQTPQRYKPSWLSHPGALGVTLTQTIFQLSFFELSG